MRNKTRLLLIGVLLVCFYSVRSQCKVRSMVSSNKPNLKPYLYDSYAFNPIEIKNKPQKIEIQFSAFIGQRYKLVFSPSAFEEKIKIKIYSDKGHKDNRRIEVFDSDNAKSNSFFSFEAIEPGEYFIVYEVPAVNNPKVKKGCMVLLVGLEM